jgi:hypothetical protein
MKTMKKLIRETKELRNKRRMKLKRKKKRRTR